MFLDTKKVTVGCVKYERGRNPGIIFRLKYTSSSAVTGKLEKSRKGESFGFAKPKELKVKWWRVTQSDVTLFIILPSKWTLLAQHRRPCSPMIPGTQPQNDRVTLWVCGMWPWHSPMLWCLRGPTEICSQSLRDTMLSWSWWRQVGRLLLPDQTTSCVCWGLTAGLRVYI